MANPALPIQQGSNLATLETDNDIEQALQQEEDMDHFEEVLGLEPEQVEEEVIELDDGSVIINYTPTEGPMKNPEFYANLAEEFDEDVLDMLANDMIELIEVDKQSREDRDKQYEEGLRRTGLGKDAPGGATFDGASKVVHPVMAESCVDFAASAARELVPPDGIVKADIKGTADRKRMECAERKADFMNWQLSEQIPEYRDEFECLLTQLPLGGSQYMKWRYDLEQMRPMCEWVPIDAILLPYSSSNFYTASRVTEVQDITEDEFQRRVDSGIYRDIDSGYDSDIDSDEMTRSQKANNKIEGKSEPSKNVDGVRRIYEITCFLRLEEDGETDGRRAPYILTIDQTSDKVLALYRNWAYGDEKLEKLDWYVEFKFIPWRGAYAIGLPHLIGGLSAALTGSLRSLLDAAHINNSQTMLKLKTGRVGGQSDRIEPTQVIEVESGPGVDDIRKIAMPMPFNPPSPVLFQLLGWLTDAAKGVVTTAEEKIANANSNMPVGTTQALIEQGAKVFSSIHARLHRSQAKSLQILSRINHWYLEEMDNQSGVEIEVRDFAANNDVRPVSDPNIFSETQRLAQAQAVLQMATQAPQLFDLRAAYNRVLKQLKVPNINEVLPNPEGIKESNPALENVAMSMGRHAAAYPDQDHLAHIQVHLAFAQDPNYGGSPLIGPAYAPMALEHIKQHLTLHYLQSMRNYVAQASGGEDSLKLHEERPLRQDDQKALALAAQMVSQDSKETFASAQPALQDLVKKVQQAQQNKQQQLVAQDPTAQAIVQTQMAETKRKSEEAQATMQLQSQKDKQEYELKVAELKQKVAELQAKYQTQSDIDSQRNAKDIAMANINNAAKERVAMIQAGAQLDQQQAQLEHEQNQSAFEATRAAEQDIRNHGIAVQQQEFQSQVDHVKNQLKTHQQAALADQQHQQTLQQADQQHQQALQQQAATPQPQPQTPTEGQ
jgi:chaperonin GroES